MSRRAAMCPGCGSATAVLEVRLVVGGEPLSFALCSACEWKSWSGLVGPLSLDSVLRLASVDGPAPAGRPSLSRRGPTGHPARWRGRG
jgi:hypothetical protein